MMAPSGCNLRSDCFPDEWLWPSQQTMKTSMLGLSLEYCDRPRNSQIPNSDAKAMRIDLIPFATASGNDRYCAVPPV